MQEEPSNQCSLYPRYNQSFEVEGKNLGHEKVNVHKLTEKIIHIYYTHQKDINFISDATLLQSN